MEGRNLIQKKIKALYLCDKGLGIREVISKEENVFIKDAEEILKKLEIFGFVSSDEYKDKDLKIYKGLKTKEEIEDFKKKYKPSFYTTQKGREFLKNMS